MLELPNVDAFTCGKGPYVAHALAVFGPHRVLFGSDWPVLTLASSYLQWVEPLDALTAELSADDRWHLWSGNARRWYLLPPPSST